jgi:ABC-type lipoprotein export system ATPase subunit
MHISNITISKSPFFGEKFRIDLNSKLNCIMGGRGSGKTTILCLINWALSDDAELSREVLGLLKANLGSATLQILFTDNDGFTLQLTRSFGSPPAIKNQKGDLISIEELKRNLTIDFFPAGSIEKIGVNAKERLKIFDGYIEDEIEKVKSLININVSQLRQNEIEKKTSTKSLLKLKEDLNNYNDLFHEMSLAKAELASVETDAGLKESFESENLKQRQRTIEINFIDKAKDHISKISNEKLRLFTTMDQSKNVLQEAPSFQNKLVENLRFETLKSFSKIDTLVGQIEEIIKPLFRTVEDTVKELRAEHLVAEGKFSQLNQNIAKHRDLYQKINLLNQKETAQKLANENIKKSEEQLLVLDQQRVDLLKSLSDSISKRSELRRIKANEINSKLGGKVKILVKNSALNEPFQDIIRSIVSKNQMRITSVETKIFELSTPGELISFLKEDDPAGYASKLEIDKIRVTDLFKILKDSESTYDLEVCICEDSPNFFLAVEDNNKYESFKPTEQLSTGQRCTAVLPVIFAITKNPLLIDQPEDNLDNRYIANAIHDIIRSIKESRQLIFVTHNPNIPVISDAEYNMFLSYSEQQSKVLVEGTIANVRDQIIEFLEGGMEAFVKRKDFYGY